VLLKRHPPSDHFSCTLASCAVLEAACSLCACVQPSLHCKHAGCIWDLCDSWHWQWQLVLLKIVQLSVDWIVESTAFGMGRRGLYELLPQV
jgi:hypothetical protein